MSKFEVGDRVAVYHDGIREEGEIKEVFKNQIHIYLKKAYEIDDNGIPLARYTWAHEKQCRRLVKKKKPDLIRLKKTLDNLYKVSMSELQKVCKEHEELSKKEELKVGDWVKLNPDYSHLPSQYLNRYFKIIKIFPRIGEKPLHSLIDDFLGNGGIIPLCYLMQDDDCLRCEEFLKKMGIKVENEET